MLKSSPCRPVSLGQAAASEEPLEFQVVPEVGLRNDFVEFTLGMPLNQVISMIQQNANVLQNVRLAYSKKNPYSRDICISLTRDGIKLYFDPTAQLLRLIHVDDLTNIVLKYNDKTFSEPGAEASLDKVDEYFGSTHPGAYDEKQKLYVQSWRGLSFYFPNSGNVQVAPGFGPNMRSLQYDGAAQPRLTKMSIFKGSAPNMIESAEMPLPCYCGQNRTVLVECDMTGESLKGIDIVFCSQGSSSSSRSLDSENLVEIRKTISFGDTVASVLSALGAPSKVFYKSEDKMSIHREGGKKETLGNVPHFFFNYFSMGIDVLFDFKTKRVIKFVFHTNLPGHYNFGIYARCEFRCKMGRSEQTVISNTSKFNDILSVFNDDSTEKPSEPVISRRRDDQDPFGSTYLYGTNQLIVEVMPNEHIAAITLYDGNL